MQCIQNGSDLTNFIFYRSYLSWEMLWLVCNVPFFPRVSACQSYKTRQQFGWVWKYAISHATEQSLEQFIRSRNTSVHLCYLHNKIPAYFSLPNPPPLATLMELGFPESKELLRWGVDLSPSTWGELYLMATTGGSGFLGEGANRLLKLNTKSFFLSHPYILSELIRWTWIGLTQTYRSKAHYCGLKHVEWMEGHVFPQQLREILRGKM